MTRNADEAWIVERAKALGFDLCGIVRTEKFPELDHFEGWLSRGYSGEMNYLHDARRADPSLVMEGLRSAIVCALSYNTAHPYSTEAAAAAASTSGAPRGWISRYAWGDDYHSVMWEKLNALSAALTERFSERFAARVYADTGPIAERIFAKYAGLGWLGKNTLLLNESYGSWLFLGVVLTSLDLPPSLQPGETPPADLCGNCRQCLDACPTNALVEPYVLDARRCISYLTIELRGSVPEQLREPLGWQVYGCDICQDVCPYNRSAPSSPLPQFEPRQDDQGRDLLQPELQQLAEMDEPAFRNAFRNSAIKRTKWVGLVRNACLALGNTRFESESEEKARTEALLTRLAKSELSTIAESANWSLKRIQRGHD
jgi:epoxyqueuosine reductase